MTSLSVDERGDCLVIVSTGSVVVRHACALTSLPSIPFTETGGTPFCGNVELVVVDNQINGGFGHVITSAGSGQVCGSPQTVSQLPEEFRSSASSHLH